VEPGYSSTKLTYADYLRFPDDGLRHEIIGGEHYVTPSPATRHQRISRNLLYLIQSQGYGGQEAGLRTDGEPRTVRRCSNYFRNTTIRFVFVPLLLLSMPQQFAVLVNS
jgi:hypothetical protein